MKKFGLLVIMSVFALSACATDPYTGESRVSRTAIGTVGGAAAGAGVGALVKGKKGAAWGAGIGALAGAATGGYMDLQAKELRQELQGTGVSVAEIDGNVYLVMPGNVTFDSSSFTIKSSFTPVLNSVAKVLKKYNKTIIVVSGHTDSTGSASTNNTLSLNRANAVANYLKVQGVDGGRMSTFGYASQYPIASNTTAAGREQNRRVEIALQQIQ